MSRSSFVSVICVAIVAVTMPTWGCRRAARTDVPNILLVTIDTLRADHCSAYGYPLQTTPVLEKLARAGTLFERAYSPTATTGPSHAALLASQPPRTLGVLKNGHVLSDAALTLPEVLAANGYATAAFVSSLPVRRQFGFGQGFEHYDEEFTPEDASRGREKSDRLDRRADATARVVVDWLGRRRDRRPLFAWVHLVDPHYPYKAPEPFRAKWPRGTTSAVRAYDTEIRFADKHLGAILDAFEKVEAPNGTLVVVTSDHGEGLGQHGWGQHGVNLYEEAVRVPLVLAWRGRLEGDQVKSEPAALMDVAPTLLDLVGVTIPEEFEGHDLIAELEDTRAVFLERRQYKSRRVKDRAVRGEMLAIVRNGWKYIRAPQESGHELYHLTEDPAELNDLASTAPNKRRQLEKQLRAWADVHPHSPVAQEPLDREALEALRALGYVD